MRRQKQEKMEMGARELAYVRAIPGRSARSRYAA